MAQTASVRIRIDQDTKEQAEAILHRLGLNPSEAVRLLYRQVIEHGGLPFDVKIPNEENLKAIDDAFEGRGVKRYRNEADAFGDL